MSESGAELESVVRSIAERLGRLDKPVVGSLLFRSFDSGEEPWSIHLLEKEPRVERGFEGAAPEAEVACDPEVIRAVMEGRIDGRQAFLQGGIRVRGDISLLERLSLALGTHTHSHERGAQDG